MCISSSERLKRQYWNKGTHRGEEDWKEGRKEGKTEGRNRGRLLEGHAMGTKKRRYDLDEEKNVGAKAAKPKENNT